MRLPHDELPAKGAAVFTNDGGILSVCLSETEGDAPTMMVGLQRHGCSMMASISIADAAIIARSIESMVARLLLLEQE
jgi:hypothetical protein